MSELPFDFSLNHSNVTHSLWEISFLLLLFLLLILSHSTSLVFFFQNEETHKLSFKILGSFSDFVKAKCEFIMAHNILVVLLLILCIFW
jgi:hypothetical protein